MKQETLFYQATQSIAWVKGSVQILLGTLYIALLSQVEIPLKPIPVTMQTFAIFSLALFQGSKKSSLSLIFYLVAATVGLPVFPSAIADPFWIFDPSAGYCLSFPLAAYLVGRLAEIKNPPSAAWMMGGLCMAQFLIYLMGVSWLSFFIGWKQALVIGLYPFVLFDAIKLFAAFSIKMAARPFIHYCQLLIKK
jgi:biotin transport system substrate-specific component